ncbi:MAG: FAD:protein FMN transferase [Armatimonadota bacterium]|nr:MAG: FAD:protein FMN transferase [Armatimonadota bacterium]
MTEEAASLLRFRRRAMGCIWELTLSADQPDAPALADAAFEQVSLAEKLLSVFLPSSDISRINREGQAGPVKVSPLTLRALAHAFELSDLTGGTFDIACGALVRLWGFEGGEGRKPAQDEISRALKCTGRHNVLLDEAAGTVRLVRPGVRLNPGGYGKGFGLDLAMEALRAAGAQSALMHAGTSSVAALGVDSSGRPWQVGIRIPGHNDGRAAVLELQDGSLSVSGISEQSFSYKGRRFGHVLDPRTGYPVEREGWGVALCESAAASDALATAALVLGPEGTERILRGRGEVRVIFYDEKGRPIREVGGGSENGVSRTEGNVWE